MSKALNDPCWAGSGDPFADYGRRMPRGLPRPLYEGRPVAYTTAVRADYQSGLGAQAPAFDLADSSLILECRAEGLCIVCGEALAAEATVVWDTKLLGVVDDWMHDRCASLALAHCPHLVRGAAEGTLTTRTGTLDELRLLPRIYASSGGERLEYPFGSPPSAESGDEDEALCPAMGDSFPSCASASAPI